MMRKSLLAALLPILFLVGGCIDTRTMPVDYGAAVDPMQILVALNKPTENMHATDIKVGEFVALRTTQDLAMGASFAVVGDTGATITEKNEDSDRVIYSGVIHDLSYEQDGSYSKVSREGEVLCASKVACACGECDANPSTSADQPGLASDPLAPSVGKPTVVTKAYRAPSAASTVQNLTYTSPAKLMTQAVVKAAAIPAPTFHRFSAWKTREEAPWGVKSQPGCLGIPGCMIDIYHVMFDEVFWEDPKGNRVHIETKISPNVPYLSRNLSTCQSLLVNVGTSGSNILLKQCTDVFDFRFER